VPEPPPAVRLQLERPGDAPLTVEVREGAPIDLWPLVDDSGAPGLAARGAGGEIVHATTAYRRDHDLRLSTRDGRSADVELRRRDGALVARARDVRDLRLTEQPGEPAPAATVTIDGGGRSKTFAASALPGLARASARRRDGVPLADLVTAAGWELAAVRRIEVRSGDGQRTLDGAAVREPGRIRVRSNNRGQLVLTDSAADGDRLRGITRLTVVTGNESGVIQRK
jgi:hypothetical protein